MSAQIDKYAFVVGTFDTKGPELAYIANCLIRCGIPVKTVDVGTSSMLTDTTNREPCDFSARTVAEHLPAGARAVTQAVDRGTAIDLMSQAFRHFLENRTHVAGVIGASGSGGTALLAPAFRGQPIGLPKLLVSTVASGNVSAYVGGSDITMMYSVTDVQGLNSILKRVLGNAAHALGGMIKYASNLQILDSASIRREKLPAVALSMFGVTTPCVQSLCERLDKEAECLVFHATGIGGMSMEKLADSNKLAAIIDITTTEIADRLVGGIFPASDDRLGAVIRTRIPYIGSVGALDMVNFGALESVPEKYKHRLLHNHNSQVTLMRTTVDENVNFARWIADKLNAMQGEVRFLLPQRGVSMLDVKDEIFFDPDATTALIETLVKNVRQSEKRKLILVDANINDTVFTEAVITAYTELTNL